MPKPHTVVIGGGIAGLSVAWALAMRGTRRVTLLERENAVATHSSARNAQIWLPVDDDATTGPLARRSAEALTALLGQESAWRTRSDALALSDGDGAWIVRGAEKSDLRASPIADPIRFGACLTSTAAAFRVDGAGVMDTHAMIEALRRACLGAGVSVHTGARAEAVEVRGNRVAGVFAGDRTVACDEVVNAAGAWAGALGRGVELDVPLVPLRRHLMVLEAPATALRTTAWLFGARGVYCRPESGGILASPCDEVPAEPCLPTPDPRSMEWLAERLEGFAPSLIDAPVRTHWACLRTYAHDRELVLGPDPRLGGFVWLAGLGGRGMTVGVGAGLLCAAAMHAEADPLLDLVRPNREQPPALVAP